jgi:hypothetical protein
MPINLRNRCAATLLCWGLAVLYGLMVFAARASPLRGANYELGRGLELPALNLSFSGYTSLRARNLEGEAARFDLRDLSLFARWQPTARWLVFSEIELENTFVADSRGWTTDDIEAEVERIYVDYALTATLGLRVGRFLTPFGRWNQLHADPLVWTVSRPLVTTLILPDHAIGIAMVGNFQVGGNALDYTLYVDDSDDFDPVNGGADFEDFAASTLINDFEYAGGGQLRYHFFADQAELAASYASYEFAGLEGQRHALGIDGLLRWQRFEFSAEMAYRVNEQRGARDDWGAFLQAVVPLASQIYGIARAEYYRSGILAREAGRIAWGLAYRPLPPLNLKFEFHEGTDRVLAPDGFEMSLSVLF